jgi:hypothetical protein
MSALTPSLPEPATGPTLADVLELTPDTSVSSQARQNMASSIRAIGRVLDRELRHIPIHAATYRKLIERASPGALGLSASRWRNVKSDVNRAIRLSGLSVNSQAKPVPLTAAWERLLTTISLTRTDIYSLRRFARFCCSLQCSPEDVAGEIVDRYLADLGLSQLAKDPEITVRTLVRVWNKKIIGIFPDRFVALPRRSKKVSYGPTWDELPSDLVKDAEAFRQASLNPPIFDTDEFRKPISQFTATQRHRMIRRIAAAEILSGVALNELRSLADLVAPDRLKRALQFFINRNDGEPSVQAYEVTYLSLCIARHWAKLPDDQIALIRRWTYKLCRINTGMAEKNCERLRQFTGAAVIQRVLSLPDCLLAKAQKHPSSVHTALMVQKAVAIAVLTVAPIRIGNLRLLDREVHFRRAFSVDDPRHHLVISAKTVKNNIDLEFPIPDHVMALIDLYMATYQPQIANGHPSSLLFPGRSGQPKEISGLRNDITSIILKETGLHMNPHLFRHFAAYLFLKANPGQYEAVRQLLSHKRIETTINFYANFETDAAMHQFNRVIDSYRETAPMGGAF